MTTITEPDVCAVCGAKQWRVKYQGPIRHGTHGNAVAGTVFECRDCGVGFLPSSVGLAADYYVSTEYRSRVGEGADAESFFARHDVEQLDRYPLLDRVTLRGSVVAEIGCGGGSFLDGVRGLASTTIAVEPAESYHRSLRSRGHVTFANVSHAHPEWAGKVDVAVSFSVIEHVAEPVAFLEEIRTLLAPDGQLLVSTPNARDLLLNMSEPYQGFFYRSVHAFYFDARSLEAGAKRAGFTRFEPRYVHRFNFANFIGWLQQHKPTGNTRPTPLGGRFDRIWKTELEESGRSDYLYAWLGN